MIDRKRQHINFVEQKPYESVPFDAEEKELLISAGVMYQAMDGKFVFQIVGAAVIGRNVIYVLPKFESDIDQDAKTGVAYVQAIKQYLLSGSRRSSLVPTLDDIPLIMRTFEELNSFYIEFGVYKERRNVHVASETRRINWPKTINRNQALFSNVPDQATPRMSVLYAEPIITTHSSYEGDLSRLFRGVLTLLATFIAPIMRMRHPLESRASIDKVVDAVSATIGRSNYYKRVLRAHIAAEAGHRKRVLKVLYNFLSSDNEGLARIFGRRIFVFGTSDFEFVWEDAYLSAIGARRGSQELAQPRVSSDAVRVNSQRADGIVHPETPSDKVTIVDAKYYFDQQDEPIILKVGDVMKQFGYASSARATWQQNMIQNVMAFPASSRTEERGTVLGQVRVEKDGVVMQGFDPIVLLRIHPAQVFDFYVKKTPNAWLRNFTVGPQRQFVRVFKAKYNENVSKIEVSSRGNVTLKAGSIIKTSQTASRKPPPRGASVDSHWHRAKQVTASLFLKDLVTRLKDKTWILKHDVDCVTMTAATLVISELDTNTPTSIWVEYGADA